MEKMGYVLVALAICFAGANALVFQNATNRIIGGNLASQAQFPYVISLQEIAYLPNQTNAHRCGGAMITLQRALTAAQCTYFYNSSGAMIPIVPAQYRVYAGDINLSGDNITERVRTIANYTVHPEHLIFPALLNDIAIITLTTPYLNTTVVPIPMAMNEYIPIDFTLCSLAGWGATDYTSLATNALRYANKFTYNHNRCALIYSGNMNIHPNMICAASYDVFSGGCTGDIGNALVCNGELTGILSVSHMCLVTPVPEVYARVSNYTEWISSVTGGASNFRPELGLFAIAAVVLAKMFS